MKKTLLLLLALICLNAKAATADPAITMTTAKALGKTIQFSLASNVANTVVQVDFGDGTLVNKTIGITGSTIITGPLVGSQTVKIYGVDITYLNCNNQSLTAIDLTRNTALKSLYCNSNQLVMLDVTKNTALATLSCNDNWLTTLDVTKNTALTEIYCSLNRLTALDVTKNTALKILGCRTNKLTTLDVNQNTALLELGCSINMLTTLDITKNTVLTILDCSSNRLTTLDVTKNTALKHLLCSENQFTVIDVTKHTALESLHCGLNQLTALDVTKNTALTSLDCHSNPLTTLDVTMNTALTALWCSSNQLTALDVTKNIALKELKCFANQLTNLDISKNTALTELNCFSNQLTALDITKNTALTDLYCSTNQLTFATLPHSKLTIFDYDPQNAINIAASFVINTPIDLSSQLTANGNTTTYTWKTQSGITLTAGTDYTISGGITTFVKIPTQKVYCEMTNATFPDLSGYFPLKTTLTTIGNVNETPTDLTISASSINENVAANSTVGSLSTTDPNAGNTFTYTLVAGTGDTDNASFNISGSSLRISNSPNFEAKNSYSIRVRTTDQGSLIYEKAFTIIINNVNETPTNLSISASSVNENVAANTSVGSLSTTDPDAGNTFTYTLVAGVGDTDNASFNISGSSLRITNSPNFEAKSSYLVRVRTTDQGSLIYEKAFTIIINNLNETPTDLTISASSINENVAANSTVGSFSTTDPDAGNTFTYTLVAGTGDTDNASFTISGSSLRITNSPDYHTKNSYSVRVRTTDQGSLSYEKDLTITITLSTGIDDESKPSLAVYPNPCTDGFKVSGIDAPANVIITDLTGRVVVTTMVEVDGDVPVGHLKQGTYLVKVNERVLKLIKK